MSDGGFGSWHNTVYFPHTDEFVPENCGIINGLAYYSAIY